MNSLVEDKTEWASTIDEAMLKVRGLAGGGMSPSEGTSSESISLEVGGVGDGDLASWDPSLSPFVEQLSWQEL